MSAADPTRVLTVGDACALATVVGWAQRTAHLRWLLESGDIAEGTARSIGDDRGNFAGAGDDVRDCFLRVTTSTGWEWFAPVGEILGKLAAGEIAED